MMADRQQSQYAHTATYANSRSHAGSHHLAHVCQSALLQQSCCIHGDCIVQAFFKEHSPTTKKGSTQYKSAIWYHSPEQKKTAEAMMQRISDEAGKPVVTDLEPASQWTDAEDYHQKYYQRSGY